jgi:hypothetical protein
LLVRKLRLVLWIFPKRQARLVKDGLFF